MKIGVNIFILIQMKNIYSTCIFIMMVKSSTRLIMKYLKNHS